MKIDIQEAINIIYEVHRNINEGTSTESDEQRLRDVLRTWESGEVK